MRSRFSDGKAFSSGRGKWGISGCQFNNNHMAQIIIITYKYFLEAVIFLKCTQRNANQNLTTALPLASASLQGLHFTASNSLCQPPFYSLN
jgi:hypothetical protein